ncbi:hypothetical protein [Maridesulfovibrio ferrireducens]|uniref:hypothetical protein n=1 Tax=Maridesulfovibrio ferrireducens TaxID=246191 RepID=UPI001A19BBF5|nr:hypothetical protein [Maridesulfovibrio ferrireducens]MBI9110059.1 hypothetical protein [Maridesulfovibrio ferrireducens]
MAKKLAEKIEDFKRNLSAFLEKEKSSKNIVHYEIIPSDKEEFPFKLKVGDLTRQLSSRDIVEFQNKEPLLVDAMVRKIDESDPITGEVVTTFRKKLIEAFNALISSGDISRYRIDRTPISKDFFFNVHIYLDDENKKPISSFQKYIGLVDIVTWKEIEGEFAESLQSNIAPKEAEAIIPPPVEPKP